MGVCWVACGALHRRFLGGEGNSPILGKHISGKFDGFTELKPMFTHLAPFPVSSRSSSEPTTLRVFIQLGGVTCRCSSSGVRSNLAYRDHHRSLNRWVQLIAGTVSSASRISAKPQTKRRSQTARAFGSASGFQQRWTCASDAQSWGSRSCGSLENSGGRRQCDAGGNVASPGYETLTRRHAM